MTMVGGTPWTLKFLPGCELEHTHFCPAIVSYSVNFYFLAQEAVEEGRAVTWAMRSLFPLLAQRMGWAVFPGPALGKGIRPSPSEATK